MADYIDSMETKMEDVLSELKSMREQLSGIENQSFRTKAEKIVAAVEGKLGEAKEALGNLKRAFLRKVEQALQAGKTKGKEALSGILKTIRLPQMTLRVQHLLKGAVRTADQADSLETETSSAGKTYAEGQENRPSPAEKRESLKKQGSSAEPSPENGKDPRTLKTRERIEDGKKELERSGRTLKDTGKELKTAGKAARRTGYANGAVQEAAIAKEQSKRAYQAGKQLAMQGKQAVKTGAKGAKKVFQGAKTAVRTAVTAVRSVIGLVSAGAVVIFLVIILGVVGGIAGASGSSSSEALSQEVLAYTATIQRYASEFGIPEYVASIQAIMMQESGGRGTDPMQASECPYNTNIPIHRARSQTRTILSGWESSITQTASPRPGAKVLPISAGFS